MIVPTQGRVLIKKLDRAEIKKNDIILAGPTLMEENLLYGEVVNSVNENYPVGTKIFYSRYSSTKVIGETGDVYYIISDLDIMAVEK